MTTLKADQVGAAQTDQAGDGEGGHGAFAAVFDGDSPGVIEPYVRLVPPDAAETDPTDQSGQTHAVGSTGRVTFRPEDIEGEGYRLLSRALTNADVDTHHLAAMTLVQLVKFLRAAGVSVPKFPETGSVADPATSAMEGDQAVAATPGDAGR